MTLGPELPDLSDDAGNLRPEVARIIAGAPDRPIPPAPAAVPVPPLVQVPPAAPVAEPPRRAAVPPPVDRAAPALAAARAAFAQRPVRQLVVTVPDLAAARFSFGSMMVVAALAALAAGLIGASVGSRGIRRPALVPSPTSDVPATTPPSASIPSSSAPVSVNGVNVNLRTGPGLGFPVISKLFDRDLLHLGEERDGWYAATTAAGVPGYVFGAFVRGAPRGDRGPGLVVHPLVSDGSPPVVLRAGEKVFLTREASGQFLVTLPTGRRLRVSPNDVDPLD